MNKEEKSKLLHLVKTFTRDANIREAASQIGDTKILAKLCKSGMMAREACYHEVCMNSFTKRCRVFVNKESKANRNSQQKYENFALPETMICIEEALQENHAEVAPFIKLSSVKKYYQSCLMDLNAENTNVNSSRLKERILNLNESLISQKENKS